MDSDSLDTLIQSIYIDENPIAPEPGPGPEPASPKSVVPAPPDPEEAKPEPSPEELNKLRLSKLKLTMTKQDMLHLHVVAKYMFANKYTVIPEGFLDVLDDLIKQHNNAQQGQKKPRSRSNSLTGQEPRSRSNSLTSQEPRSRSNSLTSQEPLLPEIVIPPPPKRRPSQPTLNLPIP